MAIPTFEIQILTGLATMLDKQLIRLAMFSAIAALRRDSCEPALEFFSSQLVPKSGLSSNFYSATSGANRRRFWKRFFACCTHYVGMLPRYVK